MDSLFLMLVIACYKKDFQSLANEEKNEFFKKK